MTYANLWFEVMTCTRRSDQAAAQTSTAANRRSNLAVTQTLTFANRRSDPAATQTLTFTHQFLERGLQSGVFFLEIIRLRELRRNSTVVKK